ncbi:hypothetical protein ACFYKX_10665 [Cytobacillus sp. FJAT-54145]|uniref:Uncharacterized protein n=1 Tax=Cytobacillus spartinae TaxID=3299023 RepID=A0ABW6KEC3_9BACI
MFTERYAIQMRMQQIMQEREMLQEEYQQLFQRLRELDEREYVRKQQANPFPSYEHALPIKEAVKETVEKIEKKPETEETPIDQLISLHQNVEEVAVSKDEKPKRSSRFLGIDEDLASQVAQVLKKAGGKIQQKDFKRILEEKGLLNTSNFDHFIKRIMKLNPSIQKPVRGQFEYIES